MAAAAQPIDVFIAHAGDELPQLRVLVEEVLAVEAPIGGGIHLEFTVDGLVQALEQDAFLIAREERIPVRSPEELEHVPARAGEQALQLLHDRAVAAHRAIEPLQIAVDDEDQVVEPLARGEREPGERFRLVHLAITDERPDFAPCGPEEAAVLEVAHEARLVGGVDRANPHRAGRELPELRHQVRMAIGAQALATGLAAVIGQSFFRQPPLEVGARVDARSGMRLEVHQVSRLAGAEEMVEADLEEIGRRGIACDVAAELRVFAIGAHHHGERVPAHDRRNAALELEIARELRLVGERDGILIGRVQDRRKRHTACPRVVQEPPQQEGRALTALGLHQRIERVEPFPRLHGVRVGRVHAPEGGTDDGREVGHAAHVSPAAACRASLAPMERRPRHRGWYTLPAVIFRQRICTHL